MFDIKKEKQNNNDNREAGSVNKTVGLGKCLNKNKGDWICCKCSNLNYAFRDSCNRCGDKPKY